MARSLTDDDLDQDWDVNRPVDHLYSPEFLKWKAELEASLKKQVANKRKATLP
jgi:hypothetical protein